MEAPQNLLWGRDDYPWERDRVAIRSGLVQIEGYGIHGINERTGRGSEPIGLDLLGLMLRVTVMVTNTFTVVVMVTVIVIVSLS